MQPGSIRRENDTDALARKLKRMQRDAAKQGPAGGYDDSALRGEIKGLKMRLGKALKRIEALEARANPKEPPIATSLSGTVTTVAGVVPDEEGSSPGDTTS